MIETHDFMGVPLDSWASLWMKWKLKKCVGETNLKEKWVESEEKQFKE